MAAHVNRIDENWRGRPLGGHEGGLLLVAGTLLVLFFLPRAILGRGIHVSVINLVNGSWFGGYSCTQVINWCAVLAGISYIWLALGAGVDLSASYGYAYDVLMEYVFTTYSWFDVIVLGVIAIGMA